ncbi:hypothetical protein Droror1_Dr00012124 [Drosera rotundifolia]
MGKKKRRRRRRRVGDVASSGFGVVLSAGFLDPIVSTPPLALLVPTERNGSGGDVYSVLYGVNEEEAKHCFCKVQTIFDKEEKKQ